MPATSVIICEQKGRWAAALRREYVTSLRETRSLDECGRELAQSPASFVVLEITTGNVERMLEQIANWEREFPQAVTAAILPRELVSIAPWLREFGAAAVVFSLLEASGLAATIRRHLARFEGGATDVTGRVLAELPWGA